MLLRLTNRRRWPLAWKLPRLDALVSVKPPRRRGAEDFRTLKDAIDKMGKKAAERNGGVSYSYKLTDDFFFAIVFRELNPLEDSVARPKDKLIIAGVAIKAGLQDSRLYVSPMLRALNDESVGFPRGQLLDPISFICQVASFDGVTP